ncbi:MAG TPA: PAS domain-containing protein [Novosphingobium sp.]|nr:PAS domain-containing protein [Novosphingobium sp.]
MHSPASPHLGRDAIARIYDVRDADMRARLDALAALAGRLCNAPVAMVSIVLEDRLEALGKLGQLPHPGPVWQSFCAYSMVSDGLMVVPDATLDARFARNPLVTGPAHVRFYAGYPLISREGVPLGSLCVVDTAPRAGLGEAEQQALATLADAAMAHLEGLRTASDHHEHRKSTSLELDRMNQRFQVLADAMPQLVWSSTPDGQSDYFSQQWCEYTGTSAEMSHGAGWMSFLHPDDVPGTQDGWTLALATGTPYSVEYRLRRHDGEYRWMLARGLPITDNEGDVLRWIGTCTDIHERVRTTEILELMSQELSHRIKNLFAIVQGLITMSLRSWPDAAPVVRDLQARLVSLGRAHDLVRPRIVGGVAWRSETTLADLLNHLTEAHRSEGVSRLALTGPDLPIGEQEATPMTLFFHEMVTNSAKYGALSTATGQVHVELEVGEDIVINWQETGGPAILAAPSAGFGHRLAEMSVVRQMGGSLQFIWERNGLIARARIPNTKAPA